MDSSTIKFECGCQVTYSWTNHCGGEYTEKLPTSIENCIYHLELGARNKILEIINSTLNKRKQLLENDPEKRVYHSPILDITDQSGGYITNDEYRSYMFSNQLLMMYFQNMMNSYTNYKIIKLTTEEIEKWNSLLQQLNFSLIKHQGNIFGGFVRDFLILKEAFDDIDIWFTSVENKEAFIKELKINEGTNFSKIKKIEQGYSNFICSPDTYLFQDIKLDLFVYKELPVTDSIINMLLYNGKEILLYEDSYLFNYGEFLNTKNIDTHLGYSKYASPNKWYVINIIQARLYPFTKITDERKHKFYKKGWQLLPLN